MEKEEKKQLLVELLGKAERGSIVKLARLCHRTPSAIHTWTKKAWPPFDTEKIMWDFFGYELLDNGDIEKQGTNHNHNSGHAPPAEPAEDEQLSQLLSFLAYFRKRAQEHPTEPDESDPWFHIVKQIHMLGQLYLRGHGQTELPPPTKQDIADLMKALSQLECIPKKPS